MALYYCLASVTSETRTFTDSIKLEARDRPRALALARQELAYRHPGARVRVKSAVQIGKGIGKPAEL